MTAQARHALHHERITEVLRQERLIFDQMMRQNQQWFRLRKYMGYVALMILIAVAVVAASVILQPDVYTVQVVTSATGVVLVDVIAVVFAITKLVLTPNFATELRPVTVVIPEEPYRAIAA